MTDWTTCRVVRDRDGDLWFRGCDSDDLWTANTNYPDVFLTTDEVLTVFGPLAPVLNADGLPVWQPIEPGTVIKAGTRVRRPYLTDSGAVEHILPTDTPANDGWCIDPRTVPAEPVDPRAELLAEELHNHGGCEEVWPCCSVSTVEHYRNDARDLLARLDAARADA